MQLRFQSGSTAIQTYNYDEVNRLKSAEENIANVTSWKQTFTFDRYGNKRFDTGNDVDGDKTTTLDSNCATAVCNPTIDPATNKLVGYTFDNAGNTKVDATGQIFTYDAENKQILVKEANGNTIGEYFYDGDGKRVKKIANSEEAIFVYNASGQLIADYATQTSQTPKVSYLTSDHLGSPRITTDANGDIYTRRDFMAFGEEIDSSHTSERSVGLNYSTDEIRQKFTSYERDEETELDYAKARMFGSTLGRFTSPDPSLSSEREEIPQSWNRYVYTLNNPLKYIDPLGLYEFDSSVDAQQQQNFRDALDEARKSLKNIKKLYGKKSEEYKEAKKGIEAYGCEVDAKGCNEKSGTGVLVATKTFSDGEGGTAERINNDTRVKVTLDSQDLSQGNSVEIVDAIAHEGVQFQDHLNYISSGGKTKVTNYDTERRAYVVSSAISHVMTGGRTMVMNKIHYSMFNKKWTDKNGKLTKSGKVARNAEIDKLLAVPKSKGGLYEVTPQQPNPPKKSEQFFP